MRMTTLRIIPVLLALFLAHAMGGEPKIAILGDSIPYSGQWPALVEAALRQAPAYRHAEIVSMALPSETVSGLSEPGHAGGAFPRPCLHDRLDSILSKYAPTLVIACYGMNDGMMQPFSESGFQAYQQGMERLKKRVEDSGAQFIAITPPPYMADTPEKDAARYNQVLDTYAAWLASRKKDGWKVVDMRPELGRQIREAKKRNPRFIYAGDGVHPGQEGHFMIARAIWPPLASILRVPARVRFPERDEFRKALERHNLYKLAWLTETGHRRPGIPKGVPVSVLPCIREGVAVSNWHGFPSLHFKVAGRNATLVLPKTPAENRPWIWRQEFFGNEPQADIALLKEGFHVAYVDVQNMYGAPAAMDIMDRFYETLVRDYRLSPKTVLEGFSRGGLFSFNWAALHPGRVAAIYADAPVCDVASWPGGRGKGTGSPEDWLRLLDVYGATEQEALSGKLSPVNRLAPLANARIPVLAVVGDADGVVPLEENMAVVERKYRAMGGSIRVIHKPGAGHHPHSLPDPAPIVEFILKSVRGTGSAAAEQGTPVSGKPLSPSRKAPSAFPVRPALGNGGD